MKSIIKSTTTMVAVMTIALVCFPARAARDDDHRIVAAAKGAYVFRTHLKDDDIKLESRDGVVTLTGEVASTSHQEMAQDTVENLPGVRRVENRLSVKPPAEKPDDRIQFNVKSTLLLHRNVSAFKTHVAVTNGVVTLTGKATSEAQKDLTTEYVQDVKGVKTVRNLMTVVAEVPPRSLGEVVDDASITAQVKAALLTHKSTSALTTKVATRDGVVTVSGAVKNEAEKDLVTKLAKDIQGVKDVINNLTIKA